MAKTVTTSKKARLPTDVEFILTLSGAATALGKIASDKSQTDELRFKAALAVMAIGEFSEAQSKQLAK